MSKHIVLARDLAQQYHRGQFDKIGNDYFSSHVEPVANLTRSWGGTEYQVTAAYLHDLVEDTPITIEYLETHFPLPVVHIVDRLTKPKGMNYQTFIENIILFEPAVLVKLADITSNMDPARLFYIDPDTRHRLVDKYTTALPVLWRAYNGR